MIVVAIIGILAAVAIPAFIKYIARSRTVEAEQSIRKLYDGAVSYYNSDHADQANNMVVRSFPSTAGPTPAAGSCCGQTGNACLDSSSTWGAPTWEALGFQMDDPHRYWYTFTAAGSETTAQFTAAANGDLNCNKVYSTFERVGSVDAAQNVVGGEGLYVVDDIE
jgi:type IV pilus assembly protein PilA